MPTTIARPNSEALLYWLGAGAADRVRAIPNPVDSEEQADRWHHRDLEARELDPRRVWAERLVIEDELARRLLCGRPRIVHVEADGRLIDDVVWLEARARRLRAALGRVTDGA